MAVLENERVRATVALDLGGRLLSMYDRVADRELLYVNPVQQPANLALRNAWFSGGVEWNIGTRGHSPTTMDTLHAARVDGPGGSPVLRLWEWERMRDVVFQVDLWLPPESAVLLARPRIRNVNDAPVPMYWWTNAAVVATPSTRVIAPARRAIRTEYPDGLSVTGVPDGDGGSDVTWPANHERAADFFFDIAADQRPWIAAIEGDGRGIAHVSTDALRGRKLFVWGTGRGGERWQEWLSHGGAARYAEIQGGLAPTQFEHLTMPPRSEWAWTEAFGAVSVDPRRSHGADWNAAITHVGDAIDGLVDADQLDEWHAAAGAIADQPPSAVLSTGSGWGALERRRRDDAGEVWCDDAGTPFPDSTLGPDQEPWVELLETGSLPAHDTAEPPASYVRGGDWDARLAAAPASWLTSYHRAVIAHGAGELGAAVALYEVVIGAGSQRVGMAWPGGSGPRRWAHGRRRGAATAATQLAPSEWRLAAEAVARLLDDEHPDDALRFLDGLPADVRARSRMRLLEAWAAVGAGDAARAQAILDSGLEVPDLREGERSIDQLWAAAYPDRELPPMYDFRMVAEPSPNISHGMMIDLRPTFSRRR